MWIMLPATDPGHSGSSLSFDYSCDRITILTGDAVIYPTDRLTVEYVGSSHFNLTRFFFSNWKLYNDTNYHIQSAYYLQSYCVPSNHYIWASETGSSNCSEMDSLSVYGTTTFYIDYEFGGTESWYAKLNGTVSPAKISELTVTAKLIGDSGDRNVTLNVYWDRIIYQCIFAEDSGRHYTTYTCEDSMLDLITDNCSERAFAVGLAFNSSSGLDVRSISLEDEDGSIYVINDTLCMTDKSVVVDFSTVWDGDDGLDVYSFSANGSCFDTTSTVYIR